MRIEDLHMERIKPGAMEQIFNDLKWLGIDWDEGPQELADCRTSEHVQSNQILRFKKAFEELKKQELVYPCVCTRKDIERLQSAPHEHELRYPNSCRDKVNLNLSHEKNKEIRSWRFKSHPEETSFQDLRHGIQSSKVSTWSGDFIIAKDAMHIGYQLAVVLDDIKDNITHVIRGDDLIPSTHRQLHLYQALKAPHPHFAHLPLIIGHDGKRLAKRHGDWKISTLRKNGWTSEDVIGLIASTLNMQNSMDKMNSQNFLCEFRLHKIPIEPYEISIEQAKHYGVYSPDT
jgi:glutamyl-tRNA synthetase